MDVYGLRSRSGSTVVERFRTDTLVPPDLRAQAPYEFLPSNPDSRHGRLLIAREIGSAEFAAALTGLEAETAELSLGADPVTVPRNAAIRLTFPTRLPREQLPRIELLEADGGPLPARIAARGNTVVVDPVLFGTEALRRGLDGIAGMPASDIRLRVADHEWSFRASGTLPDPEPPRILGEMKMHLERVGRMGDDTSVLTIFKGGIRQAIDRGDVLRVCDAATGRPVTALEVLRDVPEPAGAGSPRRVHVTAGPARGPEVEALLERLDPGNLAGFPAKPGPERDRFVVENGPSVILVAPFQPDRGDDPANFIRFTPAPVTDTERNREDVPPRGGCAVRFSKPIDPTTLSGLDAMYLFMDGAIVYARVFAEDPAGTSFRLQPPLGFRLTPEMRRQARADRSKPFDERRNRLALHVVGGERGIADRSGVPLANGLTLEFTLDPDAPDNLVRSRVHVHPADR